MKKFISIILAIAAIAANTVFAADYPQKFYDVPKDFWAFEYIADLADRGVISGYEDGSFKPNRTVSRAEWAKIMVDAAGVTVNDNSVKFNDMQDHWANKYVNAAKNYLTGYTDGSYRPNQAATREDVTVAMVRLKGYDLSEVDYSYLGAFTDNDSISNYAKGYVAVAIAENLISGFEDGTFRGQDTLTRAEAATLLYRAFKHGNADKVVDIADTPAQTPAPSKTAAPEKNDEYKQQAESAKKTPKPTKQPTPEPTEEPTPEPTEEPTPEPTETPKPYAVDTVVAKPGIASIYNYTTDNKNNLYYTNNEYVYKVDIDTYQKEEILSLKDLDIYTDDADLTEFQVHSICWDSSANSLLLQGNYKNINAANAEDINNKFIISISCTDDNTQIITSSFDADNSPTSVAPGWTYMLCTTNDGSIVANQYIFDRSSFAPTRLVPTAQHWVLDKIIAPCANYTDNSVYFIGINDADGNCTFYEYDFMECKELFKSVAHAAGIYNSSLYTITADGVKLQNKKGKMISQISILDMKIVDSKTFNLDNILFKLVVIDDKVIFYDTAAEAFRIIKPNED